MNRIRSALVPVAVAVTLVATAAPASAAQQPNAYVHVFWRGLVSASRGAWNIDQNIYVRTRAATTYWATVYGWNNSGSAYMGLQTNGNRFKRHDGRHRDLLRLELEREPWPILRPLLG